MLFILYLTPDRSYTVVDRTLGREELVFDGDRRKTVQRRASFQIPLFFMDGSRLCDSGRM